MILWGVIVWKLFINDLRRWQLLSNVLLTGWLWQGITGVGLAFVGRERVYWFAVCGKLGVYGFISSILLFYLYRRAQPRMIVNWRNFCQLVLMNLRNWEYDKRV